MAVTLDDIATKVGVSRVTVSRALNGTGRMAERTRRRVIEAARKLKYRPNAVARATRTGRLGCIALLMSSEIRRSHLLGNTLKSIAEQLAAADYHLNITYLPDQMLDDRELVPKVLREHMSDGLLINYSEDVPTYLREHVSASREPTVWINVKRETDAVHPDDFAAGATLTRRLLEAGHRRIAYVDFSHDMNHPGLHYSALDRFAGYSHAMRAAGLQPRRVGDRRTRTRDRYAMVRGLLEPADRPTAVMSYGVEHAVLGVAMRLGFELPRDLSYATFIDAAISSWPVDVTACMSDANGYGEAIGRMMLEKLHTPGEAITSVAVPFMWHEGGSVAPPRDGKAGART